MNENNKRFTKATWQIMEQLLNVDDLADALSGSLEIILKVLNSEAGVLWVLDEKENRLYPAFHIAPCDISGISIENGIGIEGLVTTSGKSIRIKNALDDPRYEVSILDEQGLEVKTMLCVPLYNTIKKTVHYMMKRSSSWQNGWRRFLRLRLKKKDSGSILWRRRKFLFLYRMSSRNFRHRMESAVF